MIVHELKTLPEYFSEVWTERKRFELRKNDRDFRRGDRLLLREYDGDIYTGRAVLCSITYVLKDCPQYGLAEDWCILSLGNITREYEA